MARRQKSETKVMTDALWQQHRYKFALLRDRQSAEREETVRQALAEQRKGVSFAHAKAALMVEREDTPMPERSIKREPGHAPLQRQFEEAARPEQPAACDPRKRQGSCSADYCATRPCAAKAISTANQCAAA